jgi:hypothetical protein
MANKTNLVQSNRIFVPDEQSRAEAEAKELFKNNPVEDIKIKEANTRYSLIICITLYCNSERRLKIRNKNLDA